MNSALVGYGDSSDEEDAIVPPVASENEDLSNVKRNSVAALSNGDHFTHTINNDSMVDGAEDMMPMVGPSRPTDLTTASQAYEEDEPLELPPLPERDLLRYLTQPSHPATLLPPEPTTPADPSVTAKFQRFLELKTKGIHFNEDLAGKTSFKNSSLFASLLSRTGLSSDTQYASMLAPELFDPSSLPSWAYKEALLEKQQSVSAELDSVKKAQSVAGKRTIEFTSASRDSTPGIQKRKRN